MGAAILSLENYRDRQKIGAFRTRTHEALDRLLDRLEAVMADESSLPSLYALSKGVREERAEFTGALV